MEEIQEKHYTKNLNIRKEKILKISRVFSIYLKNDKFLDFLNHLFECQKVTVKPFKRREIEGVMFISKGKSSSSFVPENKELADNLHDFCKALTSSTWKEFLATRFGFLNFHRNRNSIIEYEKVSLKKDENYESFLITCTKGDYTGQNFKVTVKNENIEVVNDAGISVDFLIFKYLI